MGKIRKRKVKSYDTTEVEITEKLSYSKTKTKLYLDFGTRLFLTIISFIVVYVFLIFMARNLFSFTDEKKLNVKEDSKIDYKVYLKDNEFYDEEYLGKDMSYVSSLIKNINIDFGYNFYIDKNIDCDFTYKIIANLVISDSNSGSNFFNKEYVLSKDKVVSIKSDNKYNLLENIVVDYGMYNDLANKFKSSYGVNSDSKLIVSMKINKKSNLDEVGSSIVNTDSLMLLSIPLSEKAINIKIDNKEINNVGTVIEKSNFLIDNVTYLVVGFVLLVLSVYLVLKICRMLAYLSVSKSKYDKYIDKLLRDYDRLIVETTSFPKLGDLNVFKISKFSELLDVRDNIKLPIMYFNVSSHNKCYFYIKNNNDIYLLAIKAVDMEDILKRK